MLEGIAEKMQRVLERVCREVQKQTRLYQESVRDQVGGRCGLPWGHQGWGEHLAMAHGGEAGTVQARSLQHRTVLLKLLTRLDPCVLLHRATCALVQ